MQETTEREELRKNGLAACLVNLTTRYIVDSFEHCIMLEHIVKASRLACIHSLSIVHYIFQRAFRFDSFIHTDE